MGLAHVLYSVALDDDPLHIVRNRHHFQLGGMPIGFSSQFSPSSTGGLTRHAT